ncbi:MAG: UDP-3-O-(3-hydroxymyristoyl)glucosamine N-acyltransferase [Anaerovoracaceae bacterium]
MLVSEIIKKYIEKNIDVYNEQEVDTLGLVVSDIDKYFCTFIESEEYLEKVPTNVRMVITNSRVAAAIKNFDRYGVCVVENPKNTFFKLHNILKNNSEYKRKSFETCIGSDCVISTLSSISEKNVKIGNNVIIEPFVNILENSEIGDNCIIRSGVKIGGNDFEFKRSDRGIFGIEHYGGVIIKDNVEIQCNSVVNRALYPWDNTIIGEFTKIDALVLISHGVKIGKRCMITGETTIGGRVIIGDDSWVGLSVTIKNGVSIGEKARLNMGSVVTTDVKKGESVSGNFAIPHSKFIKYIKDISK